MTKTDRRKITCPSCGESCEATIWDSLNADLNPDEKLELIDGTLFDFICPECGQSTTLDYPLLYHDMAHAVMVSYVVDSEERDAAVEMFESLIKDNPASAATMGGYRFRVVDSQNSLREKAMAFDASLDDRVLEVLKVFALSRMLEEKSLVGDEDVFFAGMDGDSITVEILAADPFVVEIPLVSYDAVRQALEDQSAAEQPEPYLVDRDWAMETISQLN